MFEFKHKIEFQDSDTIELFGQDYFGDKSTFWNSHQTRLKNVCDKVCMTGFPIKISDLQFNKHQVIKDKNEFDIWLNQNQPFECKCSDKNDIKKRIFNFKENKRVLNVLKLNIEKEMYFKTGKDAGSGFDSGSQTFFYEYGKLLPEKTKVTLSTSNLLINSDSGEVFAFQFGQFTFLLKCNYLNLDFDKSYTTLKGNAVDGEVDFTELGNDWAIVDVNFEGDEHQYFLDAYNLTLKKKRN
ncbi:hypothetical protein [Cellulophaga sp. HaHa_2_1]|uniref:hypothetical protein n=1 Tax=Cellulophaga sp. HaHa_2_1 TaxID=2749994 RepID=UPI001C4F7B59|nr:hypothetical protein [Cellulophaga sp. HaHa_2_1]QXP51060.1 hypothetical protein H0I24_13000 [Cellulophaga sp. HaHa_2_1]